MVDLPSTCHLAIPYLPTRFLITTLPDFSSYILLPPTFPCVFHLPHYLALYIATHTLHPFACTYLIFGLDSLHTLAFACHTHTYPLLPHNIASFLGCLPIRLLPHSVPVDYLHFVLPPLVPLPVIGEGPFWDCVFPPSLTPAYHPTFLGTGLPPTAMPHLQSLAPWPSPLPYPCPLPTHTQDSLVTCPLFPFLLAPMPTTVPLYPHCPFPFWVDHLLFPDLNSTCMGRCMWLVLTPPPALPTCHRDPLPPPPQFPIYPFILYC